LPILKMEIIKGRNKPGWCGPACLAWACYELEGYYPSQKQIAWEIGVDEDWGTSGPEMVAGAALLGFWAMWAHVPLDELAKLKADGASIIVNWMSGPNKDEDGHYSVLHEVTDKTITIQDPDWKGSMRTMDRKVFEGVWWDVDEDGEKQEGWALVVKKRSKDTSD